MKKLFLSILVLFALALTTGVNVKTANAYVDPECPNGCLIDPGPGCYCYQWYYNLQEGPSEPDPD